ncbi:MAG: hypothetical protein PVSMB7_27920 [Chloroflexota bacterium]
MFALPSDYFDCAIIRYPDDPDGGNLYKDLNFPDDVYERIREYYGEKAKATR